MDCSGADHFKRNREDQSQEHFEEDCYDYPTLPAPGGEAGEQDGSGHTCVKANETDQKQGELEGGSVFQMYLTMPECEVGED